MFEIVESMNERGSQSCALSSAKKMVNCRPTNCGLGRAEGRHLEIEQFKQYYCYINTAIILRMRID